METNRAGTTTAKPLPPIHDPHARVVTIAISWRTFLIATATVFLVYVVFNLWPLLKVLALAALVATALQPMVYRLEARGWSSVVSKTVVIGSFLLLIFILISLVIPAFFELVGSISQRYPSVRDRILNQLSNASYIRRYIEHYAITPSGSRLSEFYEQINWAGGKVLGTIWHFLIFLVTSVYLLVDGPRLYLWFVTFFSPHIRIKLDQTCNEVSQLIFAFVVGQTIISLLCVVFTLVVLHVFHIPGAFILSIAAGIFDVVPVIGFFLFAIPAVLIALAVSPASGIGIALCYVTYHIMENYFIIPRIYGQKLRLSTFTVLFSLLIGWELAGVVGAIISLPLVASYSAIERIWLSAYLHRKVIREHEEQKIMEFGKEAGVA